MDKPKGKDGVIYVGRQGLQFYGSNAKGVITVNFTEKSIKDLEVVDRAALIGELQQFFKKTGIMSCPLTVIFSEGASFTDNIGDSADGLSGSLVEDFLNSVPFDSKLCKDLMVDKGKVVVCVNKDLYQTLKVGLEQTGFLCKTVMPVFAYGKEAVQAQSMDVNLAKQFLTRDSKLKSYAFVDEINEEDKTAPAEQAGQVGEGSQRKRSKKSKMIIMLGIILLLLLVVLGGVVVWRFI